MPLVRIDGRRLTDRDAFHDVFAEVFGFPEYYGRNMDAWIDCMTCVDDPGAGMTTVHGMASDPVVLQIDDVGAMPRELLEALVDCAAFVNWRRIERGEPAVLVLSYRRSNEGDAEGEDVIRRREDRLLQREHRYRVRRRAGLVLAVFMALAAIIVGAVDRGFGIDEAGRGVVIAIAAYLVWAYIGHVQVRHVETIKRARRLRL